MSRRAQVTLSLLMVAVAAPAPAATFDSAQRTTSHTIESVALDEQRTIMVRTPIDYDPETRYPVVFVTDGEWNFELVASYLDYMADSEVYPRLIVTGVINVNRNRDYIPRVDEDFDDTGGAERFLAFVRDEWVPFVAGRYSASENRILIGHSFGGVITIHTFFTEPELFDAYIALGTSAWMADGVLMEEAEAWFASPRNADAFVYMAVGEGDGGPTVPSSKTLAALFELNAPESLEWTFDITPRTDHFKNMASGMHDGFMALFPAWGFVEQLNAVADSNGTAGVDRWFLEKRTELGYRFLPAWFDLGVAALGMMRRDQLPAALATMRHLRQYHPQNPDVAAFSARVLEADGQLEAAAAEYERAIHLATEHGLHPNEIHIGRLQRGLERVRTAPETERTD